jgi:D-glycero-D-manno-heptose 1,7-bisphosphate phosphatase
MRALFLDRDGVINRDAGYTHRWEDFVFIDGIFELVRSARRLGYAMIVVTNQAGIGRGLYTEAQFLALTDRMLRAFSDQGAPIDKVYFSPYHPTHGIGHYRQDSIMRKPNPGMLLQAAEEFGLDLPGSLLVGDKHSDIGAGLAAGVGTNLLFRPSPDALDEEASAHASPTAIITRLAEAESFLIRSAAA